MAENFHEKGKRELIFVENDTDNAPMGVDFSAPQPPPNKVADRNVKNLREHKRLREEVEKMKTKKRAEFPSQIGCFLF